MGKMAGSQPVKVLAGVLEAGEAQGSRPWVTSLEVGQLPWVGGSACAQPATSSLPPPSLPLRVISTGASRMGFWTRTTPATSRKASRAFQTMWMQPWLSLLIATVAGSGSTSSRVLREWAGARAGGGAVWAFLHNPVRGHFKSRSPPLLPCQELLSHKGQRPWPWRWLSCLAHEPGPIPLPCTGRQYWEYEFQQQPSQEECEGSSLSAVFEHFALLQRDSWESFFELLFWTGSSGMEGGWASLALSPRGLGSPG